MNLKEHIEKFDELHPESVEIDYTEKLFAPVEKLETDMKELAQMTNEEIINSRTS